jgi:RHS repeat-associated protein
MFTGREYDKETGLYYYRARYYNPQIGRFLQTDPVGYDAGMNWYAYCGNSPIGLTDPSGLWASYTFQWVETGGGPRLGVQCLNADGGVGTDFYFTDWLDLFDYVNGAGKYTRPGDFCDGKFDRAVFNASLDAAQAADPTYGTGGAPPFRPLRPYNPADGPWDGRDLAKGEVDHVFGEYGEKITTHREVWHGGPHDEYHIAVRNPEPGNAARPGQVHLQRGSGGRGNYWKFNPYTRQFEGEGMSNTLNKWLLRQKEVRRAVERAIKQVLGETDWHW